MGFLSTNIPLFECPDKDFEQIYYFRWWTYRKHIKQTPDGFVITEFLPHVGWAGKHNTINCAAGPPPLRGPLAPRPGVPRRLLRILVPQGRRPEALQFLGR